MILMKQLVKYLLVSKTTTDLKKEIRKNSGMQFNRKKDLSYPVAPSSGQHNHYSPHLSIHIEKMLKFVAGACLLILYLICCC